MQIITNSPNETKIIASDLSKNISVGKIIALIGDLGSGKTTFTQGFAKGLNIDEHVGSPTFKLVSEYYGKIRLYHVDCYRLLNSVDFLKMGGENLLLPYEGITLIEWADIIDDILPLDTIKIFFSRDSDAPNKRIIEIKNLNGDK